MSKSTKIFIVEGEDRDNRIINYLADTFFVGKYNATIIPIPAKQNLYMLYQAMKKSDFAIDLLELVRDNVEGASEKLQGINRENVDEIYLFFDFDLQQNNLSESIECSPIEILMEMVGFFNNETENGKLFLSYPMIEANYDFIIDECKAFSNCYISIDSLPDYKHNSGSDNPVASYHFKYNEWKKSLESFNRRVLCLFQEESLDYQRYKQIITVESILNKQLQCVDKNQKIFVLGACPQFLFEYFNESFWKAHFIYKNDRSGSCHDAQAVQIEL